MVTPSLVIVGAPNFLSRTTYRPLGPSVTLTALATASTPCSSALRASASYFSSLCAMCSLVSWLLDLGQHVGLAEDEELLAVHLDLGAAVFAVQDLVALGDVQRGPLAGVLVDLAVANGQDLALLGLLLGGVRQDDPTRGGLLLLDCPHDQPIAEGLELHLNRPPVEVCDYYGAWHSCLRSASALSTIARARRDASEIWHSAGESAKSWAVRGACRGRDETE